MSIKIGDKVRVKDNLNTELTRLGFTEANKQDFFIGTEQTVFDLHNDDHSNPEQQYASIQLCVEIPVQCLEVIPDN